MLLQSMFGRGTYQAKTEHTDAEDHTWYLTWDTAKGTLTAAKSEPIGINFIDLTTNTLKDKGIEHYLESVSRDSKKIVISKKPEGNLEKFCEFIGAKPALRPERTEQKSFAAAEDGRVEARETDARGL